ncbi:hypothetical protein [Streptomyces melanogenes]|uniref:Uncharacterized protein n=1 Tax=Streptomyces melanogenes TaxID=67326 RepID=A0ABZ1XM42_9ACTN
MDQIIATVHAGLTERGWSVREIETDPLSGRLIVTDPPRRGLRSGHPQRGVLGSARHHRARPGPRRLAGAEWWDDADYTGYGLGPQQIADLRDWALTWATGLETRLLTEGNPPED